MHEDEAIKPSASDCRMPCTLNDDSNATPSHSDITEQSSGKQMQRIVSRAMQGLVHGRKREAFRFEK